MLLRLALGLEFSISVWVVWHHVSVCVMVVMVEEEKGAVSGLEINNHTFTNVHICIYKL